MSLIQGELGRLTVPELFRAIAAESRSGRLSVEHRDELGEKRAEVYFREGEAYHARLSPAGPRLGARLISAGLVSSEEVEEALAAQSKFGETRRLGEVLVGNRLLRRPQLESIVKEQVEDAIFDLLRWESGTFAFEPDLESDEDIGIHVSVENLVMETARRLGEWQQIARRVPSLEAIPVFTPSESGAIEVALTPEEWSFVSRIDGRSTIAQLARACGFTNLEAGRYVFGLVSTGLLALEPPDSETFAAEAEALSHANGIENLNGHAAGPQVGLIELVRNAGGIVEGAEPAPAEEPRVEERQEETGVGDAAPEPPSADTDELVVVGPEEPLVVELATPVEARAEPRDLVENPAQPVPVVEVAPIETPATVEPETAKEEVPRELVPAAEEPAAELVPAAEEPLAEPESAVEETPTVKPDAVVYEAPAVEPELIDEEAPAVEPEVIEEETPVIEPEVIEEETPVVEPEVIEEEAPVVVEPKVIEEEAPVVEPEVIEEAAAEAEPPGKEQTPSEPVAAAPKPEPVTDEVHAVAPAPVVAPKVTMPDPTFVEPDRPTLAPVFAEASLSGTTPEEAQEAPRGTNGEANKGTLVTTGSRVVAEEYVATIPTESMSSVFADLARPLDEEFEAVRVQSNGERIAEAASETDAESEESSGVRPVDPSVDTSALIREFSAYGLDGEEDDAAESPSGGNNRKAKSASERRRPGIFGRLKR